MVPELFLKIFRYVNVFYVNYRLEFQISAQLMTYNTYNKRDTRRLYYGFRVKLVVFMAQDQLFQILWTSGVLLSFIILFVAQ